jgi:hypothetical protein
VKGLSDDGRKLFLEVDDGGAPIGVLLSGNVLWFGDGVGADSQSLVGRMVRIVFDPSGKASVVVKL